MANCKRETICFNCENAVPNPTTGKGCNWSRHFKPVDGWTADKTVIINREKSEGKTYTTDSYAVYECPLFVSDVDKYANPMLCKHRKRKRRSTVQKNQNDTKVIPSGV